MPAVRASRSRVDLALLDRDAVLETATTSSRARTKTVISGSFIPLDSAAVFADRQPHKSCSRRQIVRRHVIACRLLPDHGGSLAEAARDPLLDLPNDGRHSSRFSLELLTKHPDFAGHRRFRSRASNPCPRSRSSMAFAVFRDLRLASAATFRSRDRLRASSRCWVLARTGPAGALCRASGHPAHLTSRAARSRASAWACSDAAVRSCSASRHSNHALHEGGYHLFGAHDWQTDKEKPPGAVSTERLCA